MWVKYTLYVISQFGPEVGASELPYKILGK